MRKVLPSVISFINGASAIISALNKRDALQVLSEVFQDFIALMNLNRGTYETFRNFEQRFEAQASKFNSHSDYTQLSEAILAFMMMANATLDANQRISFLAASCPNPDNWSSSSTTDDFFKYIKYESIASVILECEKTSTAPLDSLSVGAATTTTTIPTEKAYS